MPLSWHRARVDHEFRVGNDHFQRRDAPVRGAREEVLNVVVRPPEAEERVGCVKRLV